MECEEHEKAVLRKLRTSLEATASDLESKEAEVKAWLAQAQKLKSEIEDRAAKKRKNAEGQG
eukprot:711402-Pyramimonas_sp.AAC.1